MKSTPLWIIIIFAKTNVCRNMQLLRHKYFNPINYISGVARERSRATRPGRRPWDSTLTHFIQPFENALLSRNLDQNNPKNAYFLVKTVKSQQRRGLQSWPLVSGGWWLRPQTPVLLLPPAVLILMSAALALNVLYYFEKWQK